MIEFQVMFIPGVVCSIWQEISIDSENALVQNCANPLPKLIETQLIRHLILIKFAWGKFFSSQIIHALTVKIKKFDLRRINLN